MHSGRATGHIGEKCVFPQEKLSAWPGPWSGAAKEKQAQASVGLSQAVSYTEGPKPALSG